MMRIRPVSNMMHQAFLRTPITIAKGDKLKLVDLILYLEACFRYQDTVFDAGLFRGRSFDPPQLSPSN